jgi:hypothetical protein
LNYFVSREGQQYGPYSLADLQRYVAQGNIALTDQARSEGVDAPVTVQQIVGNIPAEPAPLPQQNYGQVPGYLPPMETSPVASTALPPPLHWSIVLILAIVTFGIFSWIWMFVQATYVRKLKPDSKALILFAIGLPVAFLGGFVAGIVGEQGQALSSLSQLGGTILMITGCFSMRTSLMEYFNHEENIHLQLSGVMTFFFNIIYFQYHFNQIRRWKLTGVWS